MLRMFTLCIMFSNITPFVCLAMERDFKHAGESGQIDACTQLCSMQEKQERIEKAKTSFKACEEAYKKRVYGCTDIEKIWRKFFSETEEIKIIRLEDNSAV